MFYAVRTKHPSLGEATFIAPHEIYADSAIEAACRRFNLQRRESQEGTSALLVTSWHGDAVIFDVERDPDTGAFLIVES